MDRYYKVAMQILDARIYYQQANMTIEEYEDVGKRALTRGDWYTDIYQRMLSIETWLFDKYVGTGQRKRSK